MVSLLSGGTSRKCFCQLVAQLSVLCHEPTQGIDVHAKIDLMDHQFQPQVCHPDYLRASC
jgi:ABC-type sugar transport system ATPase subunit